MRLKEVIVVEGRDDTTAIKRAVDADTIETNGSAVTKQVITTIRLAQERRGVIVFTDPDYPGQRIREIIRQQVPGCKHAFLAKGDALSKNKDDIGVENASPEAIIKALQKARVEYSREKKREIDPSDLLAFGLVGGQLSKQRRERLGQILQIGYTNGKQLINRLHMFNITKVEFEQAIHKVLQEEKE